MNPASAFRVVCFLRPAGLALLPLLSLGACGPGLDEPGAGEVEQLRHGLTAAESAFDDSSCTGTPLTRAEFIAKFAPGASEAKLGNYQLYTRTRTCSSVTGCSAWGTPVNVGTGGIRPQPLAGALTLSISSRGAFTVRVRDDSIQQMTGYYPEFPAEGSGVLSYSAGGNYRYEKVDQNYTYSGGRPIPVGSPFRVAETLRDRAGLYTWANFQIAALTRTCARIVSKTDAATTIQHALFVRY